MLSRPIAGASVAFALSCTFPDITIEQSPASSSAGATASVGAGGAGGELPCTIDEDEDGQVSKAACNGTDCNDEDPRAWFGQKAYFDSPMLGQPAPGFTEFDFDCSETEEKDPTYLLGACVLLNGCSGEGFDDGTSVCGTVNGWMKCKTLACEPQPEPTDQLLRCH